MDPSFILQLSHCRMCLDVLKTATQEDACAQDTPVKMSVKVASVKVRFAKARAAMCNYAITRCLGPLKD